ncbi:MAG: 30S ribosomal protein S12 methylthiotransferase RimO [Fimbriimonadaceae bacterium]
MPATGKPNVKVITLGCAKNEVDSEEIAGVLINAGYTLDGLAATSDVTIINTCGFLEASKLESIAAIKKAVAGKRRGATSRVIVAGCLAQRMGAELARLAPGADAYIGVGQMNRFADIVRDVQSRRTQLIDIEPPHHRWAAVESRARPGHPWSAYLKLSEGCDHNCTFCTIPSFRGGHQSKPIERVLAEARHLAAQGAVELNLIAQDVTQYGYDLYKRFTLPALLRELNGVDGIEWIRLLYFYPSRLTDEVIEALATLPKVLPYVDIPLQHAHPDVLRRMRRPWDGERYLKLLEKLRAAVPGVAIRSTFIVGFPGETPEEFQYLLDFVKAARMDRVGGFTYSREPGTPSHDMEDQVPFRLKRDRYAQLMELQQGISLAVNKAWCGRELMVLVEEIRDTWAVGRSYRDAPEIDGLVFVEGGAQPGKLIRATVTAAEPYDLVAVNTSPVKAARSRRPVRRKIPAAPL